jgi:hypothetical protein
MLVFCSPTPTILFAFSHCRYESPCSESSRSVLACALLGPRAMLTPAIATRRMLSEIFVSSRVARREQGRVNRRGQDKSRKVRPVVRVRSSAKFNHASNIANNSSNLPFLATCRGCYAFDTLRRPR